MAEGDRAPGDAAPAPEQVTMTREQLNRLLAASKAEGAAEAPPAPKVAGGSGEDEKVSFTRAELRAMVADILAQARVSPVSAPDGKPRSFHYDSAAHEQVHLPNASLYGHVVVETDVPGEFVHTQTGELYNSEGQRLGRCIVVHHAAPVAAAA